MTRSRDRERDRHLHHRSPRRRSSREHSRRRYQSEYESPRLCSRTRREEKVKEHPKQRDSVESVDGSEDLYRRSYKQEYVSENFFRLPEPILSSLRTGFVSKPSHESVNNERNSLEQSDSKILLNDEIRRVSSRVVNGLSEEQKEHLPNSRKSSRDRSSRKHIRNRYRYHTESESRDRPSGGRRREEEVREKRQRNHSIEGSESSYRKRYRRLHTPPSSLQKPESTLSSRRKGFISSSSPELAANKEHKSFEHAGCEILLDDGFGSASSGSGVDNEISEEQKQLIRVSQVDSEKNFVHMERIDGKPTNVLQGLELHTRVFNPEEQQKIVECVYNLRRMGQKGLLRERTYSEPRKWMRGKGRVTLQFGCCYNYAVDRNGNPPGIVRSEEVDPLPPLFKEIVKRMVRWNILPSTCIPNSCIVNIYEEGDCIPPHVDHHDFVRPFCSLSLLTECNIVFGSTLKVVGPGDFSGPVSIPLPVGSVLVLKGNGADIAKHCVPGVPSKRISITFRKMDDSKSPYKFLPDPDLLGIKPLI